MNNTLNEKKYSLQELLTSTGGRLLHSDQLNLAKAENIFFTGVGTDTRKDLSGQIFFALKGDVFDAHDFLGKAIEAKAAALVVHGQAEISLKNQIKILCQQQGIPVILVTDTLKALQAFANYYRRQLPSRVLAITGSNGKTTSKEFSAAVLSTVFRTHFSYGSFNNHWGVPLTILSAPKSTEVLILEMGMNHAGELTDLVKIAEPDVVVCTTVGKAHIEHFGTVDKIAEAKKEIYYAAHSDKKHSEKKLLRIFNLDNPWTKKMFEEFSTENPWIGFTKDTATYERLVSSAHSSKQQTQPQQQLNQQAVVNLSITELSMQGLKIQGLIHLRPSLANLLQATEPAQSYSSTSSPALSTSTPADLHMQVPVFGEHNLTNLMVAASLGVACGMTTSQIESALSHCRTNWGRNQLVQTQSGAQILFDGYNANPDSMQALVQNLKLIHNRGQRIGVFAEMLEMGPAAAELHHELGSLVAKENFTKVYFYGAHFEDFAKGVKMVNSKLELIAEKDFSPDRAAQIASGLTKEDIALVKGSRGMKTERFVFACQPIDFKGKEG